MKLKNFGSNRPQFGTYLFFQNLANLLFEAAKDCGYVDPKKVEEILCVSQREGEPPSKRLRHSVSGTDEG